MPAYEWFGDLPDHPGRRPAEIRLHAANLMISGVLTTAFDYHREVSALLIGDPDKGITIDKMLAAFKENTRDALTRFGVKLNGHARHYLWHHQDDLARPSTVRLSVYAAADRESAVQVYDAQEGRPRSDLRTKIEAAMGPAAGRARPGTAAPAHPVEPLNYGLNYGSGAPTGDRALISVRDEDTRGAAWRPAVF